MLYTMIDSIVLWNALSCGLLFIWLSSLEISFRFALLLDGSGLPPQPDSDPTYVLWEKMKMMMMMKESVKEIVKQTVGFEAYKKAFHLFLFHPYDIFGYSFELFHYLLH